MKTERWHIMFFSKISGLWREGDYILISGEYRKKFHVNELREIQIVDANDRICTIEDLPIRNAKILFLLKSGRKKTCYVRRLTRRKYRWMLKLLNI